MAFDILSLSPRDQIVSLYVSYFGRAPDPQGLNFWIGERSAGITSGKTPEQVLNDIAESFRLQPETNAQYPFFEFPNLATTPLIESFIDDVFNNLFGRDADAEGRAYWAGEIQSRLDANVNIGDIIVDIISGAQNTAEGQDITTLLNRIEVANEYVDAFTIGGTEWDAATDLVGAQTILNGVDDTQGSVDAAVAAIPALLIGNTYVLTAGQDNVPGTNARDTINGTDTTLTVGDTINGGDGQDTLNLVMAPFGVSDGATVMNVETLNIRAAAGNNVEDSEAALYMSGFTGVEQININLSHDDLFLEDMQEIADVRITDSDSEVGLDYDSQTVLGDDDTLDVVVDEFTGDLYVDYGIENLNLDIADGVDENTDMYLRTGANSLMITGGIEGQWASIYLDNEGDSEAPIGVEATGFLGDLELSVAHTGKLEFINTGDGDDSVWLNSNQGSYLWGDVSLGEGMNYLWAYGIDSEGSVTALSGDDEVEIGEDVYGSINLGEGDNELDIGYLSGTSASVTFGNGDNDLWVNNDIQWGATVTAGNGNNDVYVNDEIKSGRDSESLDQTSLTFGNGNNDIEVGGSIYSQNDAPDTLLTFGVGSNIVDVDNEIDRATILFGNEQSTGNNTVTASNINDSTITAFGGNDQVIIDGESGIEGDSVIDLGAGNNTIDVETGDIDDEVQVILGDGNNEVLVNDDIGDNASLTFGNGNNILDVGDDINGAWQDGQAGVIISMGNGNNDIDVGDDIDDATITIGNGVNSLTVGGDVTESTITIGTGGNFGDGDNTVDIGGKVEEGAQVVLGSGDDTVEIGTDINQQATIRSDDTDVASIVDTGDGDDDVTLYGSKWYGSKMVQSGGSLLGGQGADTLTVKSLDNLSVVERDEAQVVNVTFDGPSLQVGDVVSVTIDSTLYQYTVLEEDIQQGDGDPTGGAVADKVAAVVGADPNLSGTSVSNNVLELTGNVGADDVDISAAGDGVSYEVQQIANAEVSGFETVNLVIQNSSDVNGVSIDNDPWDGGITANFDLISGVTDLNLDSEMARNSYFNDVETTNGAFWSYESGDEARFTLENMDTAIAATTIDISADEVTASGNRQVERLTVGNSDNDHQIGDEITITIDGEDYVYAVTAGDLGGFDAQQDANNIAASIAAFINGEGTGFNAVVDYNLVTFIGSSDEDVGDFGLASDGEGDSIQSLNDATASDDTGWQGIDVRLEANMSEADDTDDDTLNLNLNGVDAFDLEIVATGEDGNNFENLALTVSDEFSHYIDTDGGSGWIPQNFYEGEITLQGGAEGETIIVDEVAAQSFISTSESNTEVYFYRDYWAGVWFGGSDPTAGLNIQTGSGDDIVDIDDFVLSQFTTIDMGEGDDLLIISNGRNEADGVLGFPALDEDDMFKNVSGVETLQVYLNDYYDDIESPFSGGGSYDSLYFDDDAFEAGFETVVFEDGTEGYFQLGGDFQRDLTIEVEDDVDLIMDLYSANAVTINAGDDFNGWGGADIWLDNNAGDLTINSGVDARIEIVNEGVDNSLEITAGDDSNAYIENYSNGSVDVTVGNGDGDSVDVENFGDGDVTITTGATMNDVTADIHGLGGLAITVDEESSINVEFFDDENDSDVTIIVTKSDNQTILLEGLNADQDVTVNITLATPSTENAIVPDGGSVGAGDTQLDVDAESGGIDTLIVNSSVDLGTGFAFIGVSDLWAVSGGEMTIDAFGVVSSASSEGFGVFIDAAAEYNAAFEETDAYLTLIGSVTAGNEIRGGSAGNDITGGTGDDALYGGEDDDIISSGDGSDYIFGGGGSDTLNGGGDDEDRDVFDYDDAADSLILESDTIVGFIADDGDGGTLDDQFDFSDIELGPANAGAAFAGTASNDLEFEFYLADSESSAVIYRSDLNLLYVDANDNQTVDDEDMVIELTGLVGELTSDNFIFA